MVPNPSIDKTAEVDGLRIGDINRPVRMVAVPGGKGLNVARAAQQLGVPVECVAILSGHAGRWIDDELDRRGLRRAVAWGEGETRTCVSVLDRSTGEMTELYENAAPVDRSSWDAFGNRAVATAREAPNGSVVVVSGSFPPGVGAEDASHLVRRLVELGRRVVIDTSGSHLPAAIESHPFMVKINAAEAASMLGVPVSTEEEVVGAAQRLAARGAQSVIITRGKDGAIGWDGTAGWRVDAAGGAGPYTVGSGDAFTAGVAWALLAGGSMVEWLAAGAAAATANTQVLGQGNIDAAALEGMRSCVDPTRIGGGA